MPGNSLRGSKLRTTLQCACRCKQVEEPEPDCYLATAQRLSTSPEGCLVIEDSPSSVHAALAAGMHVVVVPSTANAGAAPAANPAASSGKIGIM